MHCIEHDAVYIATTQGESSIAWWHCVKCNTTGIKRKKENDKSVPPVR